MTGNPPAAIAGRPPSVDRVLGTPEGRRLVEEFGHAQVCKAIREEIERLRASRNVSALAAPSAVAERCRATLVSDARPSLIPLLNLTGVALHTNLGRALLPRVALDAVVAVGARACNLEYDLEDGRRGERDGHVEKLLCELTGAEAATVVNNNAAAVWLILNSLALRKEVVVSRGELIEIGGAFRMPDIMARAGCRLREVGTTNRTHLRDYEDAIVARTGMLLKVHTSNYVIQGFTSAPHERSIAQLAKERKVPFAVDLGGGALVDLSKWGIPREPMPQDALANGANLVTFSGDKLLGGPQAGIVVGDRGLIARLRRNPIKRALRLDKLRLAALEAVLRLYRQPEKLTELLPTLLLLTRPLEDIQASAARLLPTVGEVLGSKYDVAVMPAKTEVGSGSLPLSTLPSVALTITPRQTRKGEALKRLAAAFRALPTPVIGRIDQDAFCLDLRCLDDEPGFIGLLSALQLRAA